MEPVTKERFDEWKHNPVTKKLLKRLSADREYMKEGLVTNAFENEADIKGRCAAIAILLDLQFEDLFEGEITRVADNG